MREIAGGQFESLSELIEKIPFTLKDDLRRNFPYGFLAANRADIVAYHESSGTTGGSIHGSRSMSLRTRQDVERDSCRRLPPHLDHGAGKTAIINLPFALTSSATSFYLALREAGYMTVAADQGQLLSSYTRVADLVRSLEANLLVTSDPLLLRDIALFDTGTDILRGSALEAIFCVGVPLSRRRRDWIERTFGVRVYGYYGLTEFGAVGVPDGNGRTYVHDDFFIELNNPKDPSAPNGELVIWDLAAEGSPLLRYQTGDVGAVELGRDALGAPRLYLEVLGRVSEAVFDGLNFLMPTTFQDLLVDLANVSPIHRVAVSGESTEAMRITLDVQLYDADDQSAVADLDARAKTATEIPVAVRAHKFGELFPALYGQDIYRTTQATKSLSFHDERRGEWVVTY
jgi:phenylacetate-CoA ligase